MRVLAALEDAASADAVVALAEAEADALAELELFAADAFEAFEAFCAAFCAAETLAGELESFQLLPLTTTVLLPTLLPLNPRSLVLSSPSDPTIWEIWLAMLES